MIIIKKLKWDNCFSYGKDNEINLEHSPLTQLVGINGHGKSSIPLILEEALYNKNSKNIKKAAIANRFINEPYYIYIELEVDNIAYEISIERKATLKVKLLKEGEDISSHTATNTFKNIESIIGLDYKTFSQLIYQNTNSSLQFLTATDTTRKKFLISLLNLDIYVNLFEVFKKAVKELDTEIAVVKSSCDTINNWLIKNKLSSTEEMEILEVPEDPSDLQDKIMDISTDLSNIKSTNKKISQNNEYIRLLSDIPIEELSVVPENPKEWSDLIAKKGGYESEVRAAKALINKMSGLGSTCPTCLQTIKEDKILSIVEEQENLIKEASDHINKIETEVLKRKEIKVAFDTHRKLVKEFESLNSLIDKDLSSSTLDAKELQLQIDSLKNQINRINEEIRKAITHNTEATSYNTKITVILQQTDEFKEELSRKEKELDKLLETSSHLNILKKTFSTNGLLAYKIENLVKDLEDLVNTYLIELSDGRFQLNFSVTNDKLNVIITDNGLDIDILALSSGELTRVNAATLLALRKLMSSLSKSKINVLFLDEVINALDIEGREKLIEILLKEEGLNTFLVSHGWTHPLLDKIQIIKENNISRLEE